MVTGSMTMIVVVLVVLLFAAGMWLLRCAFRSSEGDGTRVCSSCKNGNRDGARFCARCGKPLDDGPLGGASLDDTV